MASSRKVTPDNKSEDDVAREHAATSVLSAVRAALGQWPSADVGDTPARPVAVALSGGLDSTVLLDAAVRVLGPSRCVALHVHHGLSANADAWLTHTQAFASNLGVRFDARRVDLSVYEGTGVEAAARDARYRALAEMCGAMHASVLLLAHHADDQAETFVLQALRGAGLRGLASMPMQSVRDADTVIIRPLLSLPRSVLLAYAQHERLRWIDDESNGDLRYARNAVRHTVLAPLDTHFPSWREGFARSARHAAEAQALLDELAELDLKSLQTHTGADPIDGDLSLSAWRALDGSSPRRAANVLRYWVRTRGLRAMSVGRFDDLLGKLRTAGVDRAMSFAHEDHTLRHYRDRLTWDREGAGRTGAIDLIDPVDATVPNAPLEPLVPAMQMDCATRADHERRVTVADLSLHWSGHPAWSLPAWKGTLVFAATDPSDPQRLCVARLRASPLRALRRQGGERMCVAAGRPSRSLKNLFQEAGLPAWQRDVPLIFLGEQLLYVPGIGLNHAVDVINQPPAHDLDDRESYHAWCRLEWRADLLIA